MGDQVNSCSTFVSLKKQRHWLWVFCGRFHWLKGSNRQSTSKVEWYIPPSAASGLYRIKHFGHYKQLKGLRPVITPYEGTSDVFRVTGSFYSKNDGAELKMQKQKREWIIVSLNHESLTSLPTIRERLTVPQSEPTVKRLCGVGKEPEAVLTCTVLTVLLLLRYYGITYGNFMSNIYKTHVAIGHSNLMIT